MKRSRPALEIEAEAEPAGLLIGYARVSTPDQDDPQMQVDMLIKAGCQPQHIHVETASGVRAKRPMLERALKDCRRGDTLVVYKLDRFGRSLIDLLTKLADLDRRGIQFSSLTEKIDTASPGGRLIVNVMGALAQFERDLIAERTRDGIRAKIARGEWHGGTPTFDKATAEKLLREGHDAGAVAKAVGVSRARIYQLFPYPVREKLRKAGKRKRGKG